MATGDWLFRRGTSTDSLFVRQVGGGDYSHIGMVVAVAPRVMVIHATTDDDPRHLDQVLLSSLDEFLQPELAQHFAVARPTFLTPEQNRRIAAQLLASRGQPFVLDARNQPHLYCTTLLATAIRAQLPSFEPAWTRLDAPLFHGDYLFPKAFAEYPGIEWVYRH